MPENVMGVPNTVQELLASNDGDFTKAVQLVCRLAYDQLGRGVNHRNGLFTDVVRKDIYEFGEEVGQDRARELLRDAAGQQKHQFAALNRLCAEIEQDLSDGLSG